MAKRSHSVADKRQARFDWLLGDGYWQPQQLVVEFQEKQHTEALPIFDRRATVSGAPRGEQRRLYDQRKAGLIPTRGLRLVVIHKSEFDVKRDRIVCDHNRDVNVVRRGLDP